MIEKDEDRVEDDPAPSRNTCFSQKMTAHKLSRVVLDPCIRTSITSAQSPAAIRPPGLDAKKETHPPLFSYAPTELHLIPSQETMTTMAKLHDLRPVFRSVGIWKFLKRVFQQVSEDNVFVLASALAYSWLFSIFPFLILLLSLVPYLPEKTKDMADKKVTEWVTHALGKEASIVNDNVQSVLHRRRHGWLGASLVIAIWVSSGGMAMTMAALDQCYDLKDFRPWYKQRPLAIFLTSLVAVLLLGVLLLLPVASGVELWLKSWRTFSLPIVIAFNLIRYGIAVALMLTILAIIYHFGPNIRQKFHIFTPGGIFCLVVCLLLDLLFRIYVAKYARYDQTYGTVGGAAILLLFFYIIALVLLVGAEINSEIDYEVLGVPLGTRDLRGPPRQPRLDLPAAPAQEPPKEG
jgi:membrane protein